MHFFSLVFCIIWRKQLVKSGNNLKNTKFLAYYTEHEPAVRAYIRSGLYKHHDVADLMQKVAIIAWNKIDQLKDPEENFGKWMMVIARYEIMSFRRKAQKMDLPICEQIMNKILDQGAHEYDSRKDLWQALQLCTQKLKTSEQELLDVAYNSSTSIKDFAKGNNKTTQSLYQKLNRIRTALTSCVQLQMKAESS